MYIVQQIWLVRRGGTARRPVHPSAQRREREDICLPLVLVRHPRHPYPDYPHLPHRYNILTAHARLHDANEIPTRQAGQHRHYRQTKQDGRLVSTVYPRREPRLGHIQGYHERVCEQAKPQLPASYPRRPGRVTSDPRVGVHHVTDVSAARHGPARLNQTRVFTDIKEFSRLFVRA